MKNTSSLLLAAMMFVTAGLAEAKTTKGPVVQIALLLDTSSSMDGLIEQARTQLWNVVNQFATAKRHGKTPELQVALFEYGNSGLPAGESFMRQILPLTADLDRVSEELFKLRTNGGDEFCGKAIQSAVDNLKWSPSEKDLKLIFIAGNEPFSQGPTDYRVSVKNAVAKGITVNTIFCGREQEGVHSGWKDGATLADGRFLVIDQNRPIAHIAAPQDTRLSQLNRELNATFIAYGDKGEESLQRAETQSNLASKISGAVASARAAFAASPQAMMGAKSWDMVAATEGGAAMDKVSDDELPAEMQKMSVEERKAYVGEKAKQRESIQAEIRKLSKERDTFVAAERKKQASAGDSLDTAIIKAIKDQATAKDFKF